MAERTYAGAVSSAMYQGVTTGLWVSAGGLPPWKRRAARVGLTAAGVAVAAGQYRWEQRRRAPRLLDKPVRVKDVLAREATPREAEAGPGLPSPAMLVTLAVAAGMAIGGRRLEKRWLARLIRDGDTSPYRSLGIRMGALTTATSLATGLFATAEARRGSAVQARPPR